MTKSRHDEDPEPIWTTRYVQAIQSAYTPISPAPDTYRASSIEMDLKHPDRPGAVAASAHRTGLTRPGFEDHPVYQFRLGFTAHGETYDPGLYVFDQGLFYRIEEWYNQFNPCITEHEK